MSELTRLMIVANEPEAELICQLLRTEGIECFHRMTNAGAGALGWLNLLGLLALLGVSRTRRR